jgi:hypothetical protein
VSHGHEGDLSAYPEIRIAGMIAVKHRGLTLFLWRAR